MVIRDVRKSACIKLNQAGVTNVAALEVLVLMKYVWETDEIGLVCMADKQADDERLKRFENLLARRLNGEPIAYLCGKKEFMSLEFEVNSSVLIPRGDTECVVERAIFLCRNKERPSILDIGTGSGCIAVSLAASLPEAIVTGIDCFDNALEVARRNALRYQAGISFIKMDILKEEPEGAFDLIISNPPYICSDEVCGLEKEVKDYEPLTALDGGKDGLLFYRRIVSLAVLHLKKGGALVLEIGWNQAQLVCQLIDDQGCFSRPDIIFDLAGRSRGIYVTKDE